MIYGSFSKVPENISSPDRSETVLNGRLKWNVIEINGDYSWEMNMSLKLRDEWWPQTFGDCYTEVDKSPCRDLTPVRLHKQPCHDKLPKEDISLCLWPCSIHLSVKPTSSLLIVLLTPRKCFISQKTALLYGKVKLLWLCLLLSILLLTHIHSLFTFLDLSVEKRSAIL